MKKLLLLIPLLLSACQQHPAVVVLSKTRVTNSIPVKTSNGPQVMTLVHDIYTVGTDSGAQIGILPVAVSTNYLPYPIQLQTNYVTKTNVVTVTNQVETEEK